MENASSNSLEWHSKSGSEKNAGLGPCTRPGRRGKQVHFTGKDFKLSRFVMIVWPGSVFAAESVA